MKGPICQVPVCKSEMMMKSKFMLPLVAMVLLSWALSGCGEKVDDSAPGPFVMDETEYDRWEIALVDMRIEKNEEFSIPERSPLPADRIPDFEGLEYYFPQPALRFRTPFIAEAGTDTVSLVKRKGQVVDYVRRGLVRFQHEGKTYSLVVFGPVDTTGGEYLWLPFMDTTTGKETYSGGRYLDIEVDAEGMVDLDFNFAYNPLCDYDPERFNCTLPPAENNLPFPVEAGEKTLYPEH